MHFLSSWTSFLIIKLNIVSHYLDWSLTPIIVTSSSPNNVPDTNFCFSFFRTNFDTHTLGCANGFKHSARYRIHRKDHRMFDVECFGRASSDSTSAPEHQTPLNTNTIKQTVLSTNCPNHHRISFVVNWVVVGHTFPSPCLGYLGKVSSTEIGLLFDSWVDVYCCCQQWWMLLVLYAITLIFANTHFNFSFYRPGYFYFDDFFNLNVTIYSPTLLMQ